MEEPELTSAFSRGCPHLCRYEVITTPTDIIMVIEYAGGELFNYIVEVREGDKSRRTVDQRSDKDVRVVDITPNIRSMSLSKGPGCFDKLSNQEKTHD